MINFVSEDTVLGISEALQVTKNDVYMVFEAGAMGLISTSGQMGVATLDETSDYIISFMGGRLVDYIITLRGDVVRIVNPDDTISTPTP